MPRGRGGNGGGGGGGGRCGSDDQLAQVISAAVTAAMRQHRGGGGGGGDQRGRGGGAGRMGGTGGGGGHGGGGGTCNFSGTGGGGPPMRGNGGGGGGQRRGQSGGVGGGRGGNGGSGGGLPSAPAGGQGRAARWQCARCDFDDNFQSRSVCFQCGTARAGGGGPTGGGRLGTAAGGGGSASTSARSAPYSGGARNQRETSALGRVTALGPPAAGLRPYTALGAVPASSARPGAVGADGRRPILSWAGVAARPPPAATGAGDQRAPSAMGPAAAAVGSGPGGTGGAAAPPVAAARATPRTDAEGFTVVPPRHRRAGEAAHGAAGVGQQSDVPAAMGGPARGTEEHAPAAAMEDGEPTQHAQPAVPEQEGDDQGATAEEEEPSVEQLKAEFEREQQVADMLAKQGLAEDHPARVAATAQASAAKDRWQRAKPGVAVTLRMVWAEKALLRARRNQARAEQTIDDLDRDYESERARRVQELHDLRAKTREREAKLAEVSRQAAREFRHAEDVGGGAQLQGAAEAIDQQAAPVLRDLLEQLPADSPMRGRVEGVLTLLADVSGAVGRATQAGGADEFDIADDDDEEGFWHDQDGGGGADGPSSGDLHPELQEGWYHDGWGWRKAWGRQGCGNPHGDGAMDTTDAQAPAWMLQQPPAAAEVGAAAAAPAGRASKRWKVEGADPNGFQGRQVDGGEVGSQEHESAARLQAAVNDASTAASAAAAAAAGAARQGMGGAPQPPTPNGVDMALEQRKQQIWDQAQDEGVEVSMAAIAGMVAEELEEWAAAHLEHL